MKKILLPVDGCSDARETLYQVFAFLKHLNVPLHLMLLKTYNVPISAPDRVIETYDALRKRSMEMLARDLEIVRLPSGGGKISFEPLAQMGSLANVILRVVQERKIDYVVLSKGAEKNGGLRSEDILSLLGRLSCALVLLRAG